MNRIAILALAAVAVFALWAGQATRAQEVSGPSVDVGKTNISVVDAAGKPVALAEVSIRSEATGKALQVIRTNQKGSAILKKELALGRYVIEVRESDRVWQVSYDRAAGAGLSAEIVVQLGGDDTDVSEVRPGLLRANESAKPKRSRLPR